jgi:sodium-dependent phosphate cotransporter
MRGIAVDGTRERLERSRPAAGKTRVGGGEESKPRSPFVPEEAVSSRSDLVNPGEEPPRPPPGERDAPSWVAAARTLLFLLALYGFFVSIDLLSTAFKMAGQGFAEGLLNTARDPLAGVFLGLLTTALIQSSSTTTSIVVGLVAAGTLTLPVAVPIIMGANIGTTVTNTIVSMGHVTRRAEFRRAFAAGTVHDFFNLLAVTALLPLEVAFHPIERTAVALEGLFEGIGGVQMVSPLKAIVGPVSHRAAELLPHAIVLGLLALGLLFFCLSQMVRIMRGAVLSRVEGLFDRVLFRNDAAGFLLGWILTAVVQSSSATTSLVVPLAGTGVLSMRRIFPYTLGANLGTTITAILASFATGNPIAITVALAHLVFNVFGMAIFYPARSIPIRLAEECGKLVARSGKNTALVLTVYLALYILPILYVVTR